MRIVLGVPLLGLVIAVCNGDTRCRDISSRQTSYELQTSANSRKIRDLKSPPERSLIALDSLVKTIQPVPPPPRPSEKRWYDENCWQGRAR